MTYNKCLLLSVTSVPTRKDDSMRKLVVFFALVGLVIGVSQAAEKLAIGYVDINTVMLESKVGKQNRALIEKLVQRKQTMLAKEEQKM